MKKVLLINTILLTVFFAVTSEFEITANIRNEFDKDCIRGTSYWCQDLETAKKCGAVKHCIQAVWEKQMLPKDDSIVCGTCMEMVREIRKQLENNVTQDLIKGLLVGACHFHFPNEIVECIQLTEEFLLELIDVFMSKMDSQSMCSVMLFCNSEKVNLLVQEFNSNEKVSDNCQDCKNFAMNAIGTLQTMSKNAFKAKLVFLCSKLSGFLVAQGCTIAVKKNSDQLYNYMTTKMTPNDFCSLNGFCIGRTLFTKLDNTDDSECDTCHEIVNMIQTFLEENSTKTQVNEILISVCGKLGSFKEQCEKYVHTYFDIAYEFLIQSIDSEKICVEIGMCPNFETELTHEISLPFNGLTLDKLESSNDIGNGPDSCQDCKTFTVDAIPIIQEMGRDALKNKLMALCRSKLSSFLCKRVISNANANKIYKYITTQMTPDTFCNFLTMCSNNGFQMGNNFNSIECTICTLVAKNLQHYLDSNLTRTEIHNGLQWLCSKLGPVKSKCTVFLNNYFDIVYNYLIIGLDPTLVCTITGLCSEASSCNSVNSGTKFSENLEVFLEKLLLSNDNL